MSVKLLTEHPLAILSFKGGCTGSSELAHVKMPHCWKSHVTVHVKILSKYMYCNKDLTNRLAFLNEPEKD